MQSRGNENIQPSSNHLQGNFNSVAQSIVRSIGASKPTAEGVLRFLKPLSRDFDGLHMTNERLVEQNRGLASRLASVEHRALDAEHRLLQANSVQLYNRSTGSDQAAFNRIEELENELVRLRACAPVLEEAKRSLDKAIIENTTLQEEVRELRFLMSQPPVAEKVSQFTQTDLVVETTNAKAPAVVEQSLDGLLTAQLGAARFMSPVTRMSSSSNMYKFGDVSVGLTLLDGTIWVTLQSGSRVSLESFLARFSQYRQVFTAANRTQTHNRFINTMHAAPIPSIDVLNNSFRSLVSRPRPPALPVTPTMSSFMAGTSRQFH